ncbi:MAG: D-glycero-beta-D-manno-heptose-7-phosphate kinase [Candidatus Kapabacteria bacterium]|nr:D-glycero-beta-D-manno-heptose-7-phosphate kinase [Ignavibacteriota bacterium]MCW5883859.1 D-glycero-beta-D-manno-heptose-7-phosphate kinase [Candidatus Kapabacteria bacterium]
MKDLTNNRAAEIINNASGKTVAVIGDVMLDRYFWGSVTRISPEAPVPVIDVEKESIHLGGAANVAQNLKSLGLETLLCGVIGDDNSGKSFLDVSTSLGINPDGLYIDSSRPTTVKTRIIGNNQQIARIDREVRDNIDDKGLGFIIDKLNSINDLSGIILQDYNKGTVTKELIISVIKYAKSNNIPVLVDPKSDNFFLYKGVTLFKPNRKEAQQALGLPLRNKDEVFDAGKKLLVMLECENVLITLGAEGMMLFESDGSISSVPTKARHVADVSGAGDTAIATLSATISGGANIREASSMANYASGLVCEKPGIVSIKIDELLESIRNNELC